MTDKCRTDSVYIHTYIPIIIMIKYKNTYIHIYKIQYPIHSVKIQISFRGKSIQK